MTLQVVGAGLGRTGTFSLKHALEHLLGGRCYHMFELMQAPEDLPVWKAALKGEPADWDAVFHDCTAAVDYPAAYFWREILAANPGAKVVLTVRDPEAWYDSVINTIAQFEPSLPEKLSMAVRAPFSAQIRAVMAVGGFADALVWKTHFEGRIQDKAFAIEVFERHNAAVREAVPAAQLLEFEVSEGWRPLCGFLDAPLPDIPFPRLNERAAFQQMRADMIAGRPPRKA